MWGFQKESLKMRSLLSRSHNRIKTLASIFSGAALAVNLALATAALLPMAGPAEALPNSCVIRNYYQTAEMDNQVGMRSSCPGARKWGKTSKFVEVETVDLNPSGPGGPGGGPGGLPCEFLASGCSNLPQLRP
jgi:hypothetical protein